MIVFWWRLFYFVPSSSYFRNRIAICLLELTSGGPFVAVQGAEAPAVAVQGAEAVAVAVQGAEAPVVAEAVAVAIQGAEPLAAAVQGAENACGRCPGSWCAQSLSGLPELVADSRELL